MADEVKIDLSAFENSSAKSDSIDLSDFKKAEPTPKQPKKVKDDWEGSAGVVKPTPMESMEIERTRKKPFDGTTGMVKPIIRNLKEEEKAFDNVTQRRLKSKGVSFKLGDANYKKEREAVLKDVYDGTLVATENNKGEKDYGRSVGFFGSILDGATESIKSEVDAAKINTISDPTELSVYIEQEAANRADVEPVRNKYGSMIGGLPKIIALQSVGAAATAEAGGIGGPALVGADALWVGTSIKRQELYWDKKKELVDKGMDEGEAGVQAAQAAMQDAPLAAVPDAAVQYAMASMSGAETPGLTASRNAFKNYIAKPTKIAIMGATQPVAEYGIKKAQGYDVNFQDAVANSGKGFTDFYLQDLAFNVGMHPLKFAKTMVSSAKEYLSNLPKEILESTASKYGDDGKKVVDGLKTYSNARQKVAGHVPQDIIHNVAGLQEAIDNGNAKIQAMKAPDVNTPEAIIKTEEQKLAELKNRQNKIIETGNGDIHEVDDKTGLPIEQEEPTEIEGIKVVKRAPDGPNGEVIYEMEGGKFLTADGKEVIGSKQLIEQPTEEGQQPEEKTGNIKFKSAEGEDVYGKRVNIPGHEDFHIIIVEGENGPEVWEQSIGRKLGIDLKGSISMENIPDEIAKYLDKNKLTSDWLFNEIDKAENIGKYTPGEQKFKLANETEGYKKYQERKKAEEESKPFVYQGEERAKLEQIKKEAEEKGEKDVLMAIDIHLNAREGTSYRKQNIEDIQKQVDFVRNRNKQKAIIEKAREEKTPLPEDMMPEKKKGTIEELIQSLFQFRKKPNVDKVSPKIMSVLEEAYKKSSAILNKYGYYPDAYLESVKFNPEMVLARLVRTLNGRNLEMKAERIANAEAEVYEIAKQIDEYAKKEGIDLGTSAIEAHEIEANKQALLETVKGTEYENQARDAGLRAETAEGATGEVSAESKQEVEPIEGATPTEQSAFDDYTASRRADPERFKREYESERYAEFGETEEEYLRRKFCK